MGNTVVNRLIGFMAGRTQAQYTHSVPKETTPRTERINLTFRCIV